MQGKRGVNAKDWKKEVQKVRGDRTVDSRLQAPRRKERRHSGGRAERCRGRARSPDRSTRSGASIAYTDYTGTSFTGRTISSLSSAVLPGTKSVALADVLKRVRRLEDKLDAKGHRHPKKDRKDKSLRGDSDTSSRGWMDGTVSTRSKAGHRTHGNRGRGSSAPESLRSKVGDWARSVEPSDADSQAPPGGDWGGEDGDGDGDGNGDVIGGNSFGGGDGNIGSARSRNSGGPEDGGGKEFGLENPWDETQQPDNNSNNENFGPEDSKADMDNNRGSNNSRDEQPWGDDNNSNPSGARDGSGFMGGMSGSYPRPYGSLYGSPPGSQGNGPQGFGGSSFNQPPTRDPTQLFGSGNSGVGSPDGGFPPDAPFSHYSGDNPMDPVSHFGGSPGHGAQNPFQSSAGRYTPKDKPGNDLFGKDIWGPPQAANPHGAPMKDDLGNPGPTQRGGNGGMPGGSRMPGAFEPDAGPASSPWPADNSPPNNTGYA